MAGAEPSPRRTPLARSVPGPEPIRFQSSRRVTVQAIGWYPESVFRPLADEIGSVAYWYQAPTTGS